MTNVLEGSFQLVPTRERCGVCCKVSPIGFWVPNEVWVRAVPDHYQASPLCLPCFVSYADEKMIAWDDEIKFYPVSLANHVGFAAKVVAERQLHTGWSDQDA